MAKTKERDKCTTKKRKKIPTIQESLKIISYIEERDIYLFNITHFCRPADCRAIKTGDFNFTDNTVTIQRSFSADELHPGTKTYDEYTLPIHPALIERLKELCVNKMPDEFVFTHKGKLWTETRISRTWKEAAIRANLPHISNYIGVKHASASEIANETGDIFTTSKMLGHRGGIKNTLKYTERSDIKKFRTLQEKIIIPENLISD